MSPIPWAPHEFTPGTLTPLSCVRCGRGRDHEHHRVPEEVVDETDRWSARAVGAEQWEAIPSAPDVAPAEPTADSDEVADLRASVEEWRSAYLALSDQAGTALAGAYAERAALEKRVRELEAARDDSR